jgi:hypothetical protein
MTGTLAQLYLKSHSIQKCDELRRLSQNPLHVGMTETGARNGVMHGSLNGNALQIQS